jgi:hypothetical protein
MKHFFQVIIASVISLLIGSCSTLSYLPGQKAIGKLYTIGPNVHVNDAPAVYGQTIVSDDHIATGQGSSAYIHFFSGGFIQLDENTDPGFNLVWQQTNCMFIIFKHLIGQVYEETSPECSTNYQSAHASWKNRGTRFNISVSRQESVMTVLAGEMDLLSPKRLVQGRGQQMVVTGAGVRSVRNLSSQELQKVTRWRDKFPLPQASGGGSAQKACHCAD